MGHIVVMDDSEAQFALTRYSQKLWQQLRPELPEDVEYEQRGTIWVAADEEEMAEVRRKHAVLCPARSSDDRARRAELCRQLEPNLREGLAGGLLVAEDAVLDPAVCGAVSDGARAEARGGASSGRTSRADRARARAVVRWLRNECQRSL